jgi:hypothetical protein
MSTITIPSPARQLANVANAAKSTGPKTEEGKARSRANAYKHGLAGEGVVQSPELAAEVAHRYAELAAELSPVGRVAEMLVQRIAATSVRLERAVVQEAKHLSRRCRHAEAEHAEMMHDQVVALLDDLDENPATSARRLLRTPEGIEAAIATWLGLKADLLRDSPRSWTARHGELAVNLTGRQLGDVPVSPLERISNAVFGDFSLLDRSEGPGLDDEERQAWARRQLASMIDAEVEALRTCFQNLDHEAFELDRVEAPIRALFDPSKEATLARRYEAAAERGMFRSLRDLRDLQKTQSRSVKSCPDYQDGPLASFRAAETPLGPKPVIRPMAAEPVQGREEMGEFAIVRPEASADRAFGVLVGGVEGDFRSRE